MPLERLTERGESVNRIPLFAVRDSLYGRGVALGASVSTVMRGVRILLS